MKGFETGQNNVDCDILNKKDVLWPPKKYALIENKTVYLIW